MALKYEPLRQHLVQADPDESVTMTFDEIEELVGPLPPSHHRRQWWANPAKPAGGQAVSWLMAGRVVESLDLPGRTVTFSSEGQTPTSRAPKSTLIMNGVTQLEQLARRAGYASVVQLFAQNCVFLHPDTVAQTNGHALFPVVRSMSLRGRFGNVVRDSGAPKAVYFDDNRTPTDCFLWAAQRSRGPDVQYNHVWTCSNDPDAYTALWNLCATPAFLAKTTDGSKHPEVTSALRFRAWRLYGHIPQGESEPAKPAGYDELSWAASPPAVGNLEQVIRARLTSSPRSPAANVARTLGWYFSNWEPDTTLN